MSKRNKKTRGSRRRKNVRPGRAMPARDEPPSIARIKKWRGIGLYLGLVPLAGLTACDVGVSIACLPREIYLGIWAAVVGAVVGLSIRLVLERRRSQQHSPHG